VHLDRACHGHHDACRSADVDGTLIRSTGKDANKIHKLAFAHGFKTVNGDPMRLLQASACASPSDQCAEVDAAPPCVLWRWSFMH